MLYSQQPGDPGTMDDAIATQVPYLSTGYHFHAIAMPVLSFACVNACPPSTEGDFDEIPESAVRALASSIFFDFRYRGTVYGCFQLMGGDSLHQHRLFGLFSNRLSFGSRDDAGCFCLAPGVRQRSPA